MTPEFIEGQWARWIARFWPLPWRAEKRWVKAADSTPFHRFDCADQAQAFADAINQWGEQWGVFARIEVLEAELVEAQDEARDAHAVQRELDEAEEEWKEREEELEAEISRLEGENSGLRVRLRKMGDE